MSTILGTAIVLGGLTSAPTASAHNLGLTHTNYTCTSGSTSYNAQPNITRDNKIVEKVKGTTVVRQLAVCTGNNPAVAYSLVNVVNFITQGASGQFGYGQINCSSTLGCYGDWSDGEQDFWWTPTDQSLVVHAAQWVDFNGDGSHDKPQIGKQYTFSIEWVVTLNPYLQTWKYCVTDNNGTYAGTTDCTAILRHTSNYMSTIWWGVEIWNDASQLGGTDAARVQITNLQYRNQGGSIYTTVTDEGGCTTAKNWTISGNDYPANLNPPQHWVSQKCTIPASGNSSLTVYTASHT